MSETDLHARLEELKYYENITDKLSTKFDNLVKSYESITSQESLKVMKSVPSSVSVLLPSSIGSEKSVCAECLVDYNVNNDSVNQSSRESRMSLSEQTICADCLSKYNSSDYSPIWLLPRSDKLKIYENAISTGGHFTEPEMTVPFNDGMVSSSTDHDKRTFAEITKYKRDIKRKRMKHRTTKAPPLTHTEEIRSLISLQMELWEQFCSEVN